MKRAEDLIRFKWLADDCKTWDEVIEALKARIELIKYLKELGCKILQNDNDYLFYSIPKKRVKEYCKKFKMEEEDLYPFDEEK